ncbi:MAG: hypothetical protein LBD59_10105, partial [Prevotellaceae bacterium]|nr:hypothetical protein [Prevotellaceae bacterium]
MVVGTTIFTGFLGLPRLCLLEQSPDCPPFPSFGGVSRRDGVVWRSQFPDCQTHSSAWGQGAPCPPHRRNQHDAINPLFWRGQGEVHKNQQNHLKITDNLRRKCRRDGARPVSTLAGTACQNKPDEAQPRPNNGAFQQGAIYRAPTSM